MPIPMSNTMPIGVFNIFLTLKIRPFYPIKLGILKTRLQLLKHPLNTPKRGFPFRTKCPLYKSV